MKKIGLLGMVLTIIIAFYGCASSINHSVWADDYVSSIEMAKESAVKLAMVSEFQTCFIRAMLGSHIDQLPHEVIVTLNAIDKLMEEVTVENMTDCQKGQALGLWTRLVTLGILECIEAINPGILARLL